MLRTLLTDPDLFFERRAGEPGVLAPVGVVLIAGLATMSGTLLITPELVGLLTGVQRTVARVGLFIGAAGSAVGLLSLWFVYAGCFHTISRLFGATGRFREVFLLTGWGFLPAIFSGLFGGVTLYYVVQQATLPADPTQIQAFLDGLRTSPPLLVSWAVRQLVLVWQALIWTFAIKHARDLTVRESLLTVTGPIILTFGWNLFQLVS